jgi:Flp pilus assembly protein TadD
MLLKNHCLFIGTVLVGILPFLPMVNYKGFVMDDAVAVQRNPNVISPSVTFEELMRRDFWGLELFTGTWTHKSFRPVTTLSYRFGYLIHGIDSSGFHVTNLVLHFVCSMVVGWSLGKLFALNSWWSSLAGLLFACHPVHTENVLYLVGRADILASIFYALAIVYSVKRDGVNPLLLAVVGGLTALGGLSKEIGFMAPIVAGLVEVVRSKKIGTFKFSTLVIVGLSLMVSRHRYTNGTEVNMSVQDNPFSYETDVKTRWLSYAFLHQKYFQLLVFPWDLCYDYSLNAIPVLREFSDVRVLFVLAGYGCVFTGIHWVVRNLSKNSDSIFAQNILISVALMVIPFLPAANILFPVGTVIGERLLYTPSIGFIALTAIVCEKLVIKRKQLVVSFLAILIAFYLVRTGLRVQDWRDGDTLFIADGHRQQASSKTQFNLGITYMSQKHYDKAIAALVRCAAADPMSALPYWRIGQIEVLRGNFTRAEAWLMEASTKFSATLMIKDEEIFHDIAVAVFQNKKIERADFYMTLALEINSKFPKGLNNMGCLVASRDPSRSVAYIRKAVELKPDNGLYLSNLEFMAQYAGDPNSVEFAKSVRQRFPNTATTSRRDCVWEFVPAS